jgi:hypothetical protein
MQTAFFMYRHYASTIILFLLALRISAQKAPDSLAVTKLYGTSWTLQTHYKVTKHNRLKKAEATAQEGITIYDNEIHWNIAGTPYQVCSHRLRNQNEFWIDCKVNDQMIYKVVEIKGDELTIDILVRPFGKTEYVRTGRKKYKRTKL